MSKQSKPKCRNTQTEISAQAAQQQYVRQQQIVQTTRTRTIFDPDVLERYSHMVPDAPERVLRQFELNSEAERKMLTATLDAQKSDNRRRDWMAFAVIVGGLLLAALTGWLHIPWLSGASLAAIVSYAAFGYLSRPKRPEPPKP